MFSLFWSCCHCIAPPLWLRRGNCAKLFGESVVYQQIRCGLIALICAADRNFEQCRIVKVVFKNSFCYCVWHAVIGTFPLTTPVRLAVGIQARWHSARGRTQTQTHPGASTDTRDLPSAHDAPASVKLARADKQINSNLSESRC